MVAERGSAGVSQVVHESQILNLPVNGRRVDCYVLLTPAVVPDGVTSLVSFRGIAGGNAFLTDGNDTSNQFFHENAGRTRISAQISQDAAQEFQVLSTGYSAEYGRASGGIINTVTRSGSNRTAGTAYWFYRNRAMTAREPHAMVKPPEQRHQAGASLGGKLIPDKLFYFFNGEIHRRDFPLISSLARPPLFGPDGSFRGSCEATASQCAAALAFVRRNFGVLDRTSGSELGFGRVDWRPSGKNAVSASFNYLRRTSPNGYQTQSVLNNGEAFGANGNSSVRTRYGRLAWTATPNARWINELRFGWFKDRHGGDLPASLIPATGTVQITIEGQPNPGVLSEVPRLNPSENRFQLAENVTWSTGKHTVRAGADINTTLNGCGGSPRVPFLSAGGLDIDTVARTDARLARVIPLKERLSLHLNLEAFNLLNHVSQTAVNTLAYEAKGGVLRPMPGLGQGVESQGYPDGANARRLQISLRLIW